VFFDVLESKNIDQKTDRLEKEKTMRTLPILVIGGLVLWGLLTVFQNPWAGLVLLALAGLLFVRGLRKIPADPPHKAVVTILGKKTRIVKDEGWVLLLLPPFFYDLISIDVTKKNKDLTFTNVRCRLDTGAGAAGLKSGGAVTVKTSITWGPDEKELIEYIEAGKEEVLNIIEAMLGQEVRHKGAEKTWVEMTFSKTEMAIELTRKLTGVYPSNVTNLTEQAIFDFQLQALKDGVPDVWNLGIKIFRLNVTTVEPEGDLKTDAERAAREQQQREAEEREAGALVGVMAKIREKFPNLSDMEVLNAAQTERGKATRVIIDGTGSDVTKLAGSLLASGGTGTGKKKGP
jgi:regulator of protease activity HflC (stomatin/prohibitin superfamily)